MVGYGAQAIAVAQLYFLFLLYALACWAIIRRIVTQRHWIAVFVSVCLILGPVTAGLLLTLLFWIIPGPEHGFHLLIVVAAPAAVCLLNVRPLRTDLYSLSRTRLWAGLFELSRGKFIALCLFVGLAGLLALQLIVLPLLGNDPLEYMQLGRMFYDHGDAQIYPILTALPSSGFVAPWTHPPTYAVLISLAFMLQGSAAVAGAAKLIVLWFAVATAALSAALVNAADRQASWRLWLTPFLVLSLPVYFQLVQSGHIDAMRIATFAACIALTAHALASGSRAGFVFAGYATGCAMMTHSIGILAPMITLPLMAVCWRGSFRRFVEAVLLSSVTAVVIALPHYARNVAIFGNPIQDNVPVWDIQQLDVQDFLRASRGLETFADRLYLGALMPFTRSELFGVSPLLSLALIAAVLYTLIRNQGFRALATRLVTTRHENTSLHLFVAVCGFMALILLSVLAGTDLAVKNARYILTIWPIFVPALMIGLGMTLADDILSNAVLTRLSRLKRLVPRRWRGPMPAVDPNSTLPPWYNPSKGLAPLVCAVFIAFVVGSQIFSSLLSTFGNFRLYFAGLSMFSPTRLLEAERMKRAGSRLDDAALENVAQSIMGPTDSVLVFRQASYGFYVSPRFRFHADSGLVDLFKIQSPEVLRDALLARGLKWIYTPGYPLPEINNSAFAALLLDPRYVRPITRTDGWALYEVREGATELAGVQIGQAQPMVRQGVQLYATTDQGPGMVDGVQARLRLDKESGVAELTRTRGPIKELNRWDAIISRPVRTRSNPVDANAADFVMKDDPAILLKATLSGHGLAEIVVEYVSYPPVTRSAEDLVTSERPDSNPLISRETIWSGTLSETPQTVGGWLIPALSRLESAGQALERGARIIFRLRDGDTLRVHGWNASAYTFAADRETRIAMEAVQRGWVFGETLSARLNSQIRTPAPRAAAASTTSFTPIGLERRTTSPALISPPPFRLPEVDTQAADPQRPRHMLEELIATGNLRVKLRASLEGYGSIRPSLLIQCAIHPGYGVSLPELSQDPSAGKPGPKKDGILQDLPPIQLWGEKVQDLTWTELLPCIPRSVRLVLTNGNQPLLTPEERLRNLEQDQRSYLDVYDVEAALVANGGTPGRSFTIPLTAPAMTRGAAE